MLVEESSVVPNTQPRRSFVYRALQAAGGNQSRAARLLGLSRFGLRKKMSRLGIAPPETTGA